jgi:hypothetical protein
VGLGFAEQNEDCGFGVLFPVGNGLFAMGQGCGFLFQWVTGCCLGLLFQVGRGGDLLVGDGLLRWFSNSFCRSAISFHFFFFFSFLFDFSC